MTVYILDTNIVYSAVRNPNSPIARFLFEHAEYEINLIAPTFLKHELTGHFPKLVEQTGLAKEILQQVTELIYDQVKFIDHLPIPIADFSRANKLIGDVDEKDMIFVAMSINRDTYLLTGDLKLYRALRSKGYPKVLTFQQLKEKHSIK